MDKKYAKPKFTDNKTAALIGRITILEEMVETLTNGLRAMQERDGHKDSRIRFLEDRVAQLTRPRTLLTEKEAAAMLQAHINTLRAWRKEKPSRIPFIRTESGNIRY